MAEEEIVEYPDTDTQTVEVKQRQKYYENLLQFQSDVINPKSEDFYEFLHRDMDLGNIERRAWPEISKRIDFANELLADGYVGAAMQLYSEVSSAVLTSRSIDGFQQKMLISSSQTQTIKSDISQVQSAQGSGSGGLLGLFRRKKK